MVKSHYSNYWIIEWGIVIVVINVQHIYQNWCNFNVLLYSARVHAHMALSDWRGSCRLCFMYVIYSLEKITKISTKSLVQLMN